MAAMQTMAMKATRRAYSTSLAVLHVELPPQVRRAMTVWVLCMGDIGAILLTNCFRCGNGSVWFGLEFFWR